MVAGIRPLCTAANGGHPKRRQPYILPPPSRRCHGYREQASISQPISPAPACSSPLSRLEQRVHSNVHMLTLRIFQAPRDRRSMCLHLLGIQVLAGSPYPHPSSSSWKNPTRRKKKEKKKKPPQWESLALPSWRVAQQDEMIKTH